MSMHSVPRHNPTGNVQQRRDFLSPEVVTKVLEFDELVNKLLGEESNGYIDDDQRAQVAQYKNKLQRDFLDNGRANRDICAFLNFVLVFLLALEKEFDEKRSSREKEAREKKLLKESIQNWSEYSKENKLRKMKIAQKFAQHWKQEASVRKTFRSNPTAVMLHKAVNGLLHFEPAYQRDILNLLSVREKAEREAGKETKKVQKKKDLNPHGEDIFRSFLISPQNKRAFLLLTSTRTKGDQKLGEGSFKQAKWCLDMDTGEMLVVATSSKRKMTGSNIEARWEKASSFASLEATFLQQFKDDEEVVHLHGWHKTDEKCQLILEYCDEDLKSYIRDLAAGIADVDPEEEMQIIEDVIVGVRKIHAKGIIHRDLKPANIFIKDGRAKIADFGLACLESDKAACSTGAGTPNYRSPEVEHARLDPINSHSAISKVTKPKVDAWAVGLIIYQLLTRRHTSYLKQYTQSDIDKEIALYIPVKFRSLLTGLLQVRPEKRLSLQEAENMIKSTKNPNWPFDSDSDSS